MSEQPQQKQTVERYFEGFRRSDHPMILGLLTDDVVWEIHGHTRTEGMDAFDAEIENPATPGPPTLVVDRVIEDGNVVVALGEGRGRLADGTVFGFLFSDVFTFRDGLIGRVESYLVPLTDPAPLG